jgi:hypothetical protein
MSWLLMTLEEQIFAGDGGLQMAGQQGNNAAMDQITVCFLFCPF